MDVFIYSLSDPRTNEIRYVGKAIDLRRRYYAHCTDHDKLSSHRRNWLKQLRSLGLRPIIDTLQVIENSNDSDWQDHERWWISYLRFIGCPLTNLDSGGMRGKCMSAESKAKCSIASKKQPPHTEEFRANLARRNKDRVWTDEQKLKLSQANKGRKLGAEARAEMSKRRTGVPIHTPESISKIRNAIKGIKRTPQQCLNMSLAQRRSRAFDRELKRREEF